MADAFAGRNGSRSLGAGTVQRVVRLVARPPLVARYLGRGFSAQDEARVVEWSELPRHLVQIVRRGETRPMVAVMRLASSGMTLGRLALLAGCLPEVKFVALVPSCEPALVGALRDSGMTGIICEGSESAELEDAVAAVARGMTFLCERAQTAMWNPGAMPGADRVSRMRQLAGNERRVLLLLNWGLKRGQVADCLCVSSGTVDVHLARLKESLDLDTTKALSRFVETVEPSEPPTPADWK
jgi:two-component system nitrate/nitrite response regulator NarL